MARVKRGAVVFAHALIGGAVTLALRVIFNIDPPWSLVIATAVALAYVTLYVIVKLLWYISLMNREND